MQLARWFLVLGFFPLVACSTLEKKSTLPSSVVKSDVMPLLEAGQVYRYEFENGLRLIILPNKRSPTFAYQTWYRVGSHDEVKAKTGLAHLFEHLMFKGTETHAEGEFDKILERNGAEDQNAYTTRDYTVYVQELPSNKLELIADLEADRMVRLIVNDQSFKTEREVVQNERRMRTENNPDGLMFQKLYETAYTTHSYGWPVIGYQADLDNMNAEDAKAFYRNFYSPANATIIIVGDVDPTAAAQVIQSKYSWIPSREVKRSDPPAEPEQIAVRRQQLKLDIQVDKLLMSWITPKLAGEDTAALSVLDSVLSGGNSSRLNRGLVDTGIATRVGSNNSEGQDSSLFLITAQLQKGKHATQAEQAILKILKQLAEKPISEEELQRAKNRIEFQFMEHLNSNEGKAEFLGRFETLGGHFHWGVQYYQRMLKVTPADIQRVAQIYMKDHRRTVISGVPK